MDVAIADFTGIWKWEVLVSLGHHNLNKEKERKLCGSKDIDVTIFNLRLVFAE